MTAEECTNKFLGEFFSCNYDRTKMLFDNLKNIYILMNFLNNNMETIEEKVELQNMPRITLLEAEQLIDNFYKSIGIDFKLNDIIKDGTFDIVSTNSPSEATYSEMTRGRNNYIEEHKTIEVFNNGLLSDTIIWVHEISHYRNQPETKRGEANDILTELLAFTEEFIYLDYLEKIGYTNEARMYKIEEYQNLHNFIKLGTPFVKIYLLYFLMGNVSKENYQELYKEDEDYDRNIEHFQRVIQENQDAIFTILWYSISLISIYNYEKYKEDPNHLNKIKKLNTKIMNDITLEDALKIIDIKLDGESLQEILKSINKLKEELIIEETNIVRN